MERYEIVVIGAGVSGLATAASLALARRQILVLEKSNKIGGYASCFTHGGWTYDVSLHAIGDLGQGGTLQQILDKLDIWEKLDFIKASTNYTMVTSNDFVDFDGDASVRRFLSQKFPDEVAAIDEIIETFKFIRRNLDSLNIFNDDFDLAKKAYAAIFPYKRQSLFSFLNDKTNNQEIIKIFSSYWMYLGLFPTEVSLVFYAYVWTEYLCHGSYYPRGRSEAMTQALAMVIRENMGEILTGNGVEAIEKLNGQTFRLSLADGTEIESRQIVSAIAPQRLYHELFPTAVLPKKYRHQLENQRASSSSFVLYIHLSIDFSKKWKTKGHEFFIGMNNWSDVESAMSNQRIGELPFSVTVYEAIDSNYQKCLGGSTISIFVPANYDYWKSLSEENYAPERKHWQKVLLERIEAVFPGFGESIDDIIDATPLTNEGFTGSYKGAIYGAAQTLEQTLTSRLAHKTPIRGLWLAGGWTQPGAGYSGSLWSGYQTAQEILANNEKLTSDR